MSGKAKSCYLNVMDLETRKNVLNKVFFKMADLNAFIKTEEFILAYPSPRYMISKDTY